MSIYDWGGSIYNAFHLSLTFGREEKLKRDSIQSLGLQPGQRVLDWGCGTGLSLKWLSRALQEGGTIYAVDAAPSMARQAVGRARPSAKLSYHFILRSGLGVELPEPVDAAVASYSLGVLKPEQFEPAIRGIWENIKPGGRLLVLDMYVPECRNVLAKCWQKILMSFAGAVFRQDFSDTLIPAVERYFRPLEMRHDASQMAVVFLGERRDEPASQVASSAAETDAPATDRSAEASSS